MTAGKLLRGAGWLALAGLAGVAKGGVLVYVAVVSTKDYVRAWRETFADPW